MYQIHNFPCFSTPVSGCLNHIQFSKNLKKKKKKILTSQQTRTVLRKERFQEILEYRWQVEQSVVRREVEGHSESDRTMISSGSHWVATLTWKHKQWRVRMWNFWLNWNQSVHLHTVLTIRADSWTTIINSCSYTESSLTCTHLVSFGRRRRLRAADYFLGWRVCSCWLCLLRRIAAINTHLQWDIYITEGRDDGRTWSEVRREIKRQKKINKKRKNKKMVWQLS